MLKKEIGKSAKLWVEDEASLGSSRGRKGCRLRAGA